MSVAFVLRVRRKRVMVRRSKGSKKTREARSLPLLPPFEHLTLNWWAEVVDAAENKCKPIENKDMEWPHKT
mgnify:CR=1 FL=1